MSEPIKALVIEYGNHRADSAREDDYYLRKAAKARQHKAMAAIEREVAALRERAVQLECERDDAKAKLARELLVAEEGILRLARERDEARQRIADLKAERAALMSAGKALTTMPWYWWQSYARMDDDVLEAANIAYELFNEQPGALAAWMAREGR